MPDINFATGLIDGFYGKAAEERDRREKNALEAAKFLMSSGRVRNFEDLAPLLDIASGGQGTPMGGKKPRGFKAGLKSAAGQGDPQSILAMFLDPILKKQGGGAGPGTAPGSSGQPPSPAGGPPGPAAAPGGPPAAQPGPMGTTGSAGSTGSPGSPSPQARPQSPFLSDEEMADKETGLTIRKDEALTQAKIARADRLTQQFVTQGMDPDQAREAAFDVLGMKFPARKPAAAKSIGKAVPGSSLPDDAKTVEGQPIDPEKRKAGTWQPVLVTGANGEPEVRYTPGAGAKGAASFTGANEQIYQQLKGIHPDWDEERLTYETAKEAFRLEQMKGRAMVVKLNESAASNDDLDTLSDQLLDGTLLPATLSKRDKNFNHLLALASKKSVARGGKPVNFTQMALQYQAAQRFAATINGSNIMRFNTLATSVVNTIDEVQRLADELRQGSVQLWNKAKRSTILQVYGNTKYSAQAAQYVAAVNTLKEEFANLVNGGYAPTEPAFALANQQINADYGVKDLSAGLDEVQRLINYRQQALYDQRPIVPQFGGGAVQGGGGAGAPGAPGAGAGPGRNPYR